ncbi:MAG: cytidylate kinase-like family protein, partial [Lachnospiraceae bacterium]|nr:cytidylate kinase-like family protein [Lachnospiraceae bacterium]
MYPVITISREFGSGGHSIGEEVAKRLNIPFYDGEIVNQVA